MTAASEAHLAWYRGRGEVAARSLSYRSVIAGGRDAVLLELLAQVRK